MNEWRRKQKAKEEERKKLEQTKRRLGITNPRRLQGIVANPLVSSPAYRVGNTIPTSDRIVQTMGKRDLLYEHRWKKEIRENDETVKEMYRKASRIRPAYNKGALQYLPKDFDK